MIWSISSIFGWYLNKRTSHTVSTFSEFKAWSFPRVNEVSQREIWRFYTVKIHDHMIWVPMSWLNQMLGLYRIRYWGYIGPLLRMSPYRFSHFLWVKDFNFQIYSYVERWPNDHETQRKTRISNRKPNLY